MITKELKEPIISNGKQPVIEKPVPQKPVPNDDNKNDAVVKSIDNNPDPIPIKPIDEPKPKKTGIFKTTIKAPYKGVKFVGKKSKNIVVERHKEKKVWKLAVKKNRENVSRTIINNTQNDSIKFDDVDIVEHDDGNLTIELRVGKILDETLFTTHKGQGNVVVEIKNLVKTFGKGKRKMTAINNLSMKVYEHENVAIMGANGAGKTTLVETIVGLNKPNSGSIVSPMSKGKYDSSIFGIQFQSSTYPYGLSVNDVIKFVIQLYKIKIEKKEIESLKDTFGITEFCHKRCNALSGGQSQRLNVMLALLHRPKVLFLDELSTGLDIKIRTNINAFIKTYAERYGITLVLISHNIAEIKELCTRLIIMKKGEIMADLSIKDVNKYHHGIKELLDTFL